MSNVTLEIETTRKGEGKREFTVFCKLYVKIFANKAYSEMSSLSKARSMQKSPKSNIILTRGAPEPPPLKITTAVCFNKTILVLCVSFSAN